MTQSLELRSPNDKLIGIQELLSGTEAAMLWISEVQYWPGDMVLSLNSATELGISLQFHSTFIVLPYSILIVMILTYQEPTMCQMLNETIIFYYANHGKVIFHAPFFRYWGSKKEIAQAPSGFVVFYCLDCEFSVNSGLIRFSSVTPRA
jgi:hypothetical protein